MRTIKMGFWGLTALLFVGYSGLLSWFYLNQEELIFRPDPLPQSHEFTFPMPFEEITIPTDDGERLHGLLFRADSTDSKGLVFYLHGNRGSLDRWGNRAGLFVENGFDVFFLDYRGYGKSTGTITSESQFLGDVDLAYNRIAGNYQDRPKAVVGYSLGTGPAAYLAQKYQPELLVLMAPYYNLPDLASELYPYLPESLSKYEFATNRYLPDYGSSLVIFHGDGDRLIGLESSRRLSRHFTDDDTLIVLQNQGHGRMHRNPTYRQEIARLLGDL